MRKLIYTLSIVLVGILIFNACEDNPLDVPPSNQMSEENVWNDPALIEAYINNIYRGLDHGANQAQMGSMADEGSSIPDLGTGVVVQSTASPGNMGNLLSSRSDQFKWDELYSRIRQLNTFFEEIDEASIENQELKNRLTGEAHFLRAYFYHNLMRAFGGVPLVTEVYGLGDEMNDPRASFEETVNFIVQEAEAAADLLPVVHTDENIGRASGGAALALKARVLLYAASDLYHMNPSDMAETGYTSSPNRTQMWRDAKNAAEAVMDLNVYGLFRSNPAPGDSTASNYYELFHTLEDNEEVILARYFTTGDRFSINQNYRPHIYHGPNGFHQWGGTTPIQQMVDAYQMEDGSEFSWDDPAQANNPYENRDPRFYGTILYDGAEFRERPSDAINMDRDGVIQSIRQIELPNGNTVPGIDTRESPIEPWNGTWSGYYLRKILDENASPQLGQVPGMWIFFRYGEVLLNYAEASIELGEEVDARNALNQIRRRAGMPEFDATVTGQELEDQYRYERRIELAFEEHRFFDIRRWMIAPDVMNEDAGGIIITAEATDRADRSTYTNYNYELMTYQNRSWDDKMYFYPISQDEMNRNSELVQNPGY